MTEDDRQLRSALRAGMETLAARGRGHIPMGEVATVVQAVLATLPRSHRVGSTADRLEECKGL